MVVTVMDQDLEKYRGHRVDQVQAFITKPFALAQLERTLAQVLGIPPAYSARTLRMQPLSSHSGSYSE